MEHVHWWLAGLAFTLGMVLDADGPARRTSSAGKEIGPRVKR